MIQCRVVLTADAEVRVLRRGEILDQVEPGWLACAIVYNDGRVSVNLPADEPLSLERVRIGADWFHSVSTAAQCVPILDALTREMQG